jgi:hypothetical protein
MKHKCDGCQYKGEHQEMGFISTGVCGRERNLADAIKAYESNKCPYKKMQTNYDRIRAMSVDETAVFLTDFKDCCNCIIGRGKHNCHKICDSVKSLTDWLNSPAEGE